MSILFLLFRLTSHSQGIKPQNVYRVTVTSRYVIENGERTDQFYAINQEISDSLGRLHTEIDFDWETRYPNNYRWHYFDSMLLVMTEYYVNEKLDRRVVYEYGAAGNIVSERHYTVHSGDTALLRNLIFSYNSDRLPVRIDAVDSRGRRLYRVRSTYDEGGIETGRRVSGRRGEPSDGIIRLDRETEYDSRGNLISETVRLRMSNRSRSDYTRRFSYDDQNNVVGVTELDNVGNQTGRVEYLYQQNRNRLSQIKYYDRDDRLEKWLAKRYEIYRTPDRRERIIDY